MWRRGDVTGGFVFVEQAAGDLGETKPLQSAAQGFFHLGLIPEEETPLLLLLIGRAGDFHRLAVVGVHPGGINLGRDRHRRGREILHLLQAEAEVLGLERELGHVLGTGAGVRADEIRDDGSVGFTSLGRGAVELFLELVEQAEARLAHDAQHVVAGVFGGDLDATGHMMGGEFLDVFFVAGLHLGGHALVVQEKVVADAAGHVGVVDALGLAHGFVDVEQRGVVGVEVAADLGPDAGGAHALVADPLLLALHLIHVARGPAEVADGAAVVGHLLDRFDLAQDGLLRAGGDEFALMGGDRAEAAPAEAPAMHVDGVLDHFVGGDGAALAIFRMGQPRVGQVEGGIDLRLAHGREGRVDHEQAVAGRLKKAAGLHAVGLGLDGLEILGVELAVGGALFVGVERVVLPVGVFRRGLARRQQHGGLRYGGERRKRHATFQQTHRLLQRELAHAVDQQVSPAISQDGGLERLGPVIVVRHPPQRGLNAADHNRGLGVKLFQNA